MQTFVVFCSIFLSLYGNVVEAHYDFIIVGGGTAGLAIARRLTESRKHSVLVIESGGLPKPGMDVPALDSNFITDPDVLFQYHSQPQSIATQQYPNGRLPIIVGRVLGGSSNLNFMYFNRGNPYDYDNWARIANDSSWNYSNMLKHFKNIETYKGDYPSNQHGHDGPTTVSRPKYSPGLPIWLAAGEELGYPILDPNGPQMISFTKVEFSKRYGRRQSALRGYIEPVIDKTPNLKIVLNTNVTKVVFRGNRAVGIEFRSKSPELESDTVLYANKEVIITAGTYGSSQILQRSGIGPKNVLKAAGIPTKKELPVGENFHDHMALSIPVILNTRTAVMDNARDLTPENWKNYLKTGDGPYSALFGMSGQGFTVSSVAKKCQQEHWPDIHLAPINSADWYRNVAFTNATENSIKPWEGPMSIVVLHGRPYSRGTVHINPYDPEGLPLITGGYLEDNRDVQALLDGIKEALRIYEETSSYKKLGARIPPIPIPTCSKFAYRSDDYWRCYIRYMTTSAYHPVGTCKMGFAKNDPTAVVDSQLRVIGIQGLSVADASIMPAVTNANTQAVVYAIAEKAAETILNEWGK